MYGRICLVSVFLLLCVINITAVIHENITGEVFRKDKYMGTHVILSYDQVGPRMCVADCMMYTDCNAVNYRSDQLHCELLTETNPVNQLLNRTGSYYTQMKFWKKDNDLCTPNPCQKGEKCVLATNNQRICVQFGQ